jgi:formylglycine-generating enzyme required for sulfatase activity
MPLLSLLLAALMHTPGAQDSPTPLPDQAPGTVLIPGGTTTIGSTLEELVTMFRHDQSARQKARVLLGEYPEHSESVDSFCMMIYEVTNEQYLEFVEATGTRAPFQWGKEICDRAGLEFTRKRGEERAAAKATGKPVPPRVKFNRIAWWDRNWNDQEWSMPAQLALRPVVYVSHADALRYARWAGLRLPTEFEYERAVRGNSEDDYTWGNTWEAGRAATLEMERTSELGAVGSFPLGANEFGVMDLHGSAWEWTASPYLMYPGWTHQRLELGTRQHSQIMDAMPSWSADRRVVRGGSQSTEYVFCRATTRGGFDRGRRASALGFRCVASTRAGLDLARWQQQQVPGHIRPFDSQGPITYDENQAISRQRWQTRGSDSGLPGYTVITRYDSIVFTPASAMEANGLGELRKRTRASELTHLGLLSCSVGMARPALDPGTYMVALRGAGKMVESRSEAQRARLDQVLEFDSSKDQFVFLNMAGEPVACVSAAQLFFGQPQADQMGSKLRPVELSKGLGKDPAGIQPAARRQALDMSFFVRGRSRKGLHTVLSLEFPDSAQIEAWSR